MSQEQIEANLTELAKKIFAVGEVPNKMQDGFAAYISVVTPYIISLLQETRASDIAIVTKHFDEVIAAEKAHGFGTQGLERRKEHLLAALQAKD